LENSRNCLRGNPMNSMLLIQFWEFHSRAEPLFYDLKNYLKLNSVRTTLEFFTSSCRFRETQNQKSQPPPKHTHTHTLNC
jgi:hypothetical protein